MLSSLRQKLLIRPVVVAMLFCFFAIYQTRLAVASQPPTSEADSPTSPDEAQPSDTTTEEGHPFPNRIRAPDFPKDIPWLNANGPINLRQLRGKFVLIDFWTYCCINCIHILPELKKFERAYAEQVVVIGVHSAKFDTEKDTRNIEEAILRYEIAHPVINDANHQVWQLFGAKSWPTIVLLDPEGNYVGSHSGEITFEDLDAVMKAALPYYRKEDKLDEQPFHFDLLAAKQPATPLRFPGKVLADEPSRRLFVADSNHNRIVITDFDGTLIDIVGTGSIGHKDGNYAEAEFDHPQGMALHGSTLYVADTENHLIRKIDLVNQSVETVAGVGRQARGPWPGLNGIKSLDELPERFVGPPSDTALNSPWALWVHDQSLYIAMAGSHQLWIMPLNESEIGPYAGNGREDIIDGILLPQIPYQQKEADPLSGQVTDLPQYSSFAQPSGLASDGHWLFVADSEGSSIRAVPFKPDDLVRTVVGTADLPRGRLFAFGDSDGDRNAAQLQHALGVVYHDGTIYTADTYNNKIKAIDAATGHTTTLAGTGNPGSADGDGTFDEPAGISFGGGRLFVADTNNHQIRTVDIRTGEIATLTIKGLQPPTPPESAREYDFATAEQVHLDQTDLKPLNGSITVAIEIRLPEGWKINPLAPMSYFIGVGESTDRIIPHSAAGEHKMPVPTRKIELSLPVNGTGKTKVQIGIDYFYCEESGFGLCKVGSVAFQIPLNISPEAKTSRVTAQFEVQP
ncbi:MAG: redoxin domain-containing protein [Pirellulaceae bacterium]|nr:redoxin domain-containing protein [Pirellulaceae bacterium]